MQPLTVRIIRRCIVGATVFGLTAGPASALEYSVQPMVSATATHNDNIRLTPSDHLSLQGREVRTRAAGKVASENWMAELELDLKFNSFNRSEYDSDDQFLDLKLNKNTERQNYGLNAGITRDSTRTSEVDTSGNVGIGAERRELYSFNPYWSGSVDDRNRISLQGGVTEVQYGTARFTDYQYYSLYAGWDTTLDEDLRLNVQLSATNYQPDSRPATYGTSYSADSTGLGVQVGGEYKMTEQFTINALVGSTETEQEYSIGDPLDACQDPFLASFGLTPDVCALRDYKDRNFTTDISLDWRGERSYLSIGYTIENQPSSQGYEVESEQFNLDGKYRVSEKGNLTLVMLVGRREAVDVSASAIDPTNSNRDFANSTITYSHKVTENWRVNAIYGYRWQDREIATDDAESHTVKLGIEYQPTKSIWSR